MARRCRPIWACSACRAPRRIAASRDLPAQEGRDGGGFRRIRRGGFGGRPACERAGARVVGVAGGADKCLWVQDSLGFDDCVDHRSLDLHAELAAACPNGIDAYFENVGGAVQAAVFDLLNPFARVAMCGMVSQYNEAEFPPGPNLGFVVGKRVLIQGFIVSDKPEKLAEWRALAGPWVADGSLSLPRGRDRRAGECARRAGRHPGRAQFRQAAGAGGTRSDLGPMPQAMVHSLQPGLRLTPNCHPRDSGGQPRPGTKAP